MGIAPSGTATPLGPGVAVASAMAVRAETQGGSDLVVEEAGGEATAEVMKFVSPTVPSAGNNEQLGVKRVSPAGPPGQVCDKLFSQVGQGFAWICPCFGRQTIRITMTRDLVPLGYTSDTPDQLGLGNSDGGEHSSSISLSPSG